MAEERMLNDEILLGLIKANSGGGGGGTTDYDDLSNKPQIGGVTLSGNKSASDLGLATTTDLEGKQDALTAGANINMTGNVVKAGVVEVVEPDMTVYGNSAESGSKTYTIETTGLYEIFYCLSLQSTVSVTLPNDANVLFEQDMSVSSHPVKHIVAELHEGDTVTIAQTPSQWNAVISGVLKLDAISVVDVAHTGSVADSTITYTLPNDNKYYLVVGACAGKPTGNNSIDSTSGGTPEITRTLTGSGVRFRSVVVRGSDSPNFSFYGYDGGVASIIAFEIEFEEGNWDYNLATKNYVNTALAAKQDVLTFDTVPTDGSTNPVQSNGVYDALATKANASDVTTALATKQNTSDNNLQTTDKTVVGGINEVKRGLTTLDTEVNGSATTYPYADFITINNAIPANLADCKVKIEPVQSGTGTPSPDNVRPITGHTESVVTRSGKNFAENIMTQDVDSDGVLWKKNDDGTITVSGTPTDNSYVSPSHQAAVNTAMGKITLYCNLDNVNNVIYNTIAFFDAEGNNIYTESDKDTKTARVYDLSNYPTIALIKIGFKRKSNNSACSGTIKPQIEIGETATAFEEYKGQTYTINLNGTIYGGTLDVDSGVMTVTHISASDTWGNMTNPVDRGDGITSKALALGTNVENTPVQVGGLCNVTDREVSNTQANIHWYTSFTNAIVFLPSDTDNDTVIQVLCQLATPTTIQLTPAQIQLLQGTNTLYASTGQISVTVNGVSGSIGAVQSSVNDIAEDVADVTADVSSVTTKVSDMAKGYYKKSVTSGKWYKIGDISATTWLIHNTLIAFNGFMLKHIVLRYDNDSHTFNNNMTKVNSLNGSPGYVGIKFGTNSAELYVKASNNGISTYTVLTDGVEGTLNYYQPIETAYTDSDMDYIEPST